ncbi:hypothetical protein [Bartonella henselae]|uniref:hypothetical protein n=1 Tax=Bartonella henselae TaxID=38323 RepID=UPI00094B0615|nr:hypothetical protein [Bartonella henselae]OLL46444.1 hypothetical protein AT242_07270 [Bartonella henselae]
MAVDEVAWDGWLLVGRLPMEEKGLESREKSGGCSWGGWLDGGEGEKGAGRVTWRFVRRFLSVCCLCAGCWCIDCRWGKRGWQAG